MNLKQAQDHARKRLRNTSGHSKDVLAMRILLEATLMTGIDDPFIKQLIHLCHPDKHNNSETSTEITRRLIAMRTQTR